MIPPEYAANPADTLFLGDARRFATVVQAIALKPGASLPELFPDRADSNAALRLFDHPHCSAAGGVATGVDGAGVSGGVGASGGLP